MLCIEIKSKRKIFGNNGIAWLWPFIFVWGSHPQYIRVRENETGHNLQAPETWVIGFPFAAYATYVLDYPIWWMFLLTYCSFAIIYGIMSLVAKLQGGDSYIDNVMEQDSRQWDDGNLGRRPRFYWLKLLFRGK